MEHQHAVHCRAERFKRDALDSKNTVHETRKTARELTRLEVNADHGKYGELLYGNYVAARRLSSILQLLDVADQDVCYSIYKEFPEKPSWWLESLGDYRPGSINSANKEVLLVLIAKLMDRRLARLVMICSCASLKRLSCFKPLPSGLTSYDVQRRSSWQSRRR